MLQACNGKPRRWSGAARYVEIVWNPLNIVSQPPGIATSATIQEWQQ
jgi:hypothetical protein